MAAAPTRDEAWELVCEWIESDSLRKHLLGVEAAMVAYADRFDADRELYAVTGLLHDLDYERFPDLATGHPRIAMEELARRGYPDAIIRAIGSHADETQIARETPMEKALYAVDELSGFLLACAYVRPEGLQGMTPKSVKKKMKTASFAAAIHRDQLRRGAEDLGVDFDEHVAFVIGALAEHQNLLLGDDDLDPTAPPALGPAAA